MTRHDAYIVCTSPRSGSTLLCRLLTATGRAGRPDSHFHSPSISDWAGYYGLSADDFTNERELLAAVFRAARARGTGDAELFGLRLQGQSAAHFMRKLSVLVPGAARDADRVRQVFGETLFIHLARANKLDQAISRVLATQTGLWHRAPDGTELERLSEHREPVYDPDAIARELAALTEMDARWNRWFADEGVEPMRVGYDELSADPLGTLAEVLDRLGVDGRIADGIALPLAKLAGAINERWAERFLRERGARR